MNEWKERAACVGVDPDLFFDESRTRDAIAVCLSCQVRKECFADVWNNDPPEGVWAGLTVAERRRVVPRRSAGRVPVSYKQLP